MKDAAAIAGARFARTVCDPSALRASGNAARSDRQAAELQQFLFGLPPGKTAIPVIHHVAIRALTGLGVASAEVVQLRIGRGGTIPPVDELLIRLRR